MTKKPAHKPRASTAGTLNPAPTASLFERVVTILEEARTTVVRAVNTQMVLAYWQIGRAIVEQMQLGSARADYGEQVIAELAEGLGRKFGRGFSDTNLRYFRTFYLAFAERLPEIRHIGGGESPAAPSKASGASSQAALRGFSAALGWSHYRALMKVEGEAARRFYEVEAERGGWSVAHLERQIHTQLFARLLKSRSKAGVKDLAARGQVLERPVDALKQPYVLDFLDLPESNLLRESDLESAILEKLQQFLLELGKGFAFVARQKRITFEDEHFFVDLVFYNVVLKCYLLIDLLCRARHNRSSVAFAVMWLKRSSPTQSSGFGATETT